MERKISTIVSHIILLILLLTIYLYGENTMHSIDGSYSMNDDYMNDNNDSSLIKRVLGVLLLITNTMCIFFVWKNRKQCKWIYILFILEILLFGIIFLILIYSFMFIL